MATCLTSINEAGEQLIELSSEAVYPATINNTENALFLLSNSGSVPNRLVVFGVPSMIFSIKVVVSFILLIIPILKIENKVLYIT